ncbi:MAG TPA: branched-chain amino acid transaminase [Polyangiaceae bacterium]|jgi:branched-chain amino acid aminotransferase|nr:branched-chain amino acid transaminase [Polyangiaceae bacterium]
MVCYIDGRFVEDEAATVNVRSRALNYGLGCFGGIRGYLGDDGQQVYVFRLADHIKRLALSARMIFLKLNVPEEAARDLVLELVRKNQIHHDVYLRPLVISNSTQLSPVLREEDSSFIIYSLPLKRYIDKDAIDVCVSSWRRATDNAIPARAKPTGVYLNSALARREAFDNGFEEAILLTERGYVSEGSAEHVFILREGVLISPPSTEDNLDGITRRTLISLATEDLGLKFQERPIARTELYVAEEMFLCGTGAEVTPVNSVDRRTVGAGGVGPVTQKLKAHFADVVRGRVEHRKSWLFPVW